MSRKYKFHNPEGLWQQDNHPIELTTNEMIDQKVEYIHQNPVEAGIVLRAEDYLYSSAGEYAGQKGLLKIDCYGKMRTGTSLAPLIA